MPGFNHLRNLLVLFLVFISQSLLAQDQLGVFFDAEGTENSTTTSTAYSQVPAWVQLVNPSASEALTAFEFRLEVHTDGPDPILVWDLPEQALNIEEEPVFMVGLGEPMTIQPRMTLAQVNIIVPEEGQTVWLTLHPLNEPSLLDPPEYGYPVCQPAYAVGPENELHAMSVITGCDSSPAASINPDGNPPEFQVEGLPASITLQKDPQGKQIEFVSLENAGEVSFSGLAYVSGTTPIQFEIDGHYYTNGPVSFQVPVGGSTRITPFYDGAGSVDATIELVICDTQWSIPVGSPNAWVDCAWSEESLDFGEVEIGVTEVLHVELTNTGMEPLTLETNYTVSQFYLSKIDHPGSTLGVGDSCTFRVTFSPAFIGEVSDSFTIGEDICTLGLTGTGLDGPPICLVSQSFINFHNFIIGEDTEGRPFRIENTGGGTLEGTVTLVDDTGTFSVYSPYGGVFSLGHGDAINVVVSFDPSEAGVYNAEIDLGLECNNVILRGEALVLEPECYVSAPALNFGEFVIGDTPQNKVSVIRNLGGGELLGNVSLDDPSGVFHLENYCSGPFSLGHNASHTVVVSFNPTEAGTYSAQVNLGLECGTVSLVASAIELEPDCLLTRYSLNFPNFVVGQFPMSDSFIIKNVGGGLMEGSIVLNDPNGVFFVENYSGTSYSLAHDQTQSVYIRFSAPAAGQYTAELDLGNECGSLPLSGNAVELAPACQVSESELNFVEQIVGGYAQIKYFVVKNTGGGLLEGTVTLADSISVFGWQYPGEHSYSLNYHESEYFGVRFDPNAAGQFSTTIDIGNDCGSIPVSASAFEADPECAIFASDLENGEMRISPVPLGGSRSGYLHIRNIGGGYLSGQMTLDSPDGPFRIEGKGSYSLHNNQSTYVEIVFTPVEEGPASAVVHTDSPCGDVTIVSVGEESYAQCRSYFHNNSFERVAVGDTARGYIFLQNSGYLDLEGDLQVDGEGFQFANPGPFNLVVGEYRYEEFWFIPETVGDYSAAVSTGLPLCKGDWEIEGSGVPAGSDRMGFYFDPEGTVSLLNTDEPKVRENAYLVLHNPSAEGQLEQWAITFWPQGPVLVMDDWNSDLSGDFNESYFFKRFYMEYPVPFSETMVLADFSILVQDPSETSRVQVSYANYQARTSEGVNWVIIRDPVGLSINSSMGALKYQPATPVAFLGDERVLLEWPSGPKNFEGFNVFRRVGDENPVILNHEPVFSNEGLARYEDTNLPESASEIHYCVTSLFKGVDSIPGEEVTLVLEAQESEIPVPTQTRLKAIYPNPFNPETKISFEIAQPGRVRIKIYDVSGRLMRNLTDQHFDSGQFEETWNGRDDAGRFLPSNVYYARMVAGSVVQMRKMTLLK